MIKITKQEERELAILAQRELGMRLLIQEAREDERNKVLSDLKKEIKNICSDNKILVSERMLILSKRLCKHQEQNKDCSKTHSEPFFNVSVSGEHNTGEGDGSVISQRSSSPVENPLDWCSKCKKLKLHCTCKRCNGSGRCGGAL